MALKEKREPWFGFLFFDQILFSRFFWRKELSLPLSIKQRLMYNDESEKRLNCTGRKTAKTILLEGTLIRLTCIHEGDPQLPDEGMLFAPGEVHIMRPRDRITSRFESHPIFRHFNLSYNKKEGTLKTATGLTWYIRIEGTSGRETNMVGPTTIYMIGDELAFGNHPCELGRKQTALPGCKWMYCGVPNGVRNSPFFELDQTQIGKDWSRHKLTSLDNPMYAHEYGSTEKAIKKLESEYGDRTSRGFVTQVLGKWGEETYSAFPVQMIASRPGMPFVYLDYNGAQIESAVQEDYLGDLFRLPRVNAPRYAMGLDYGYAQDPAILIIAYETYFQCKEYERYEWVELARIRFIQTTTLHQAKVIDFLNREVFGKKVEAIATDRYDIVTTLTNTDTLESLGGLDDYARKVYQSKPQGTMEILDADGNPLLDKDEKPIKVRGRQWMTEQLRNSMSYANSNLPYDHYLILSEEDATTIEELVNTVERKTAGGYVVYEPAKRGQDHNTDALRNLIYAIHMAVQKGPGSGAKEDFAGMGWVPVSQSSGRSTWKPPWAS